jgi:hypothetical protein
MKLSAAASVVGFGFLSSVASAADFSVTSPGFFYSVNGTGSNPSITLVRGSTYTFDVATASNHPFRINGAAGVSNNNISSGTITFTVPDDAVNYSYQCSIHGFGGTIITEAPPAPPEPPVVRILSLAVGSQLVIKSTGTNTWSVLPEFNTNLTTTNWFALTVNSNRFANGTNETFCGVPPGTNVFVRIRSTSN